MSEIEGQSMSDLYKGSIEINNNTPKGIVHEKDNISALNPFTSFSLENATSINQSSKEHHSIIPEQLPFTENNPHMMTKIPQSEQITYNANFSSRVQQKENSVDEQQEIDITSSIQPTSKNEINSDTIQNVSNFEGVVETPLKLFNPDLFMQNQTEMPLPNSNIDIDNNSLAQASIEQSPEPSVKKEPSLKQELSIEQQTSTESQYSNDKTSPNIGVNYQNNVINSLPYIKMENNNMETDDNFNSKENNDINVKPLRAKAADLFNVPNAHLSSEISYQDENNNQSKNEGNSLSEFGQIPQLSNVQSPAIEGNIYQSEIEQSAQLNNNQTNREPRRWRNHRSPNSSQFDNEKSDHKGSLNLRKISDAEFQALPSGSRLFLGNLSTHSTSRKELFDIFSPYGEILQISIKNSFGFVQYDNVESVKKAIEKENGRVLHGLKLGLEISYSKPWNHSPLQEEGGFKSGAIHRHKKHWNQRGGHKNVWHQNEREFSSTGRGHGQSFPNRRHNEYERRPNDPKLGRRTSYDSRSGYEYPDHKEFRSAQEFREDFKEEHDYRPREERGFRRGSYREQHREERFKHRSKPYKIPSRDFNNERRQSREHPYRSQSHDEPNEEFPLPRRQGNDVPECQIIVLEEVDRNFLWQVENAFREASSTVHILHLSRKLHPQSVIRQMVIEGVHAVVFIEKHLALNGRVNMQIFDQTRSRDNVKYDEYNNIKVEEAVGFLLRARVSQRPIEIRTDNNNLLGQQNMHQVPQLPSITGQPVSTNINPISLNNVNFAALANLLGSLQQQQQQQQQQQPPVPASAPAQGIQPIPMIPQAGGIQPSQQPNLLSQQQPQNIDVQQLLRQLAPQNSGLQNQNPFMSMPQQLAPNLASPQSHFNTAAMMNQPSNILSQNAISSGGIPLSQHQAPHINPNVSQFSTPISAPANVTDLMAQLKQYSNQR